MRKRLRHDLLHRGMLLYDVERMHRLERLLQDIEIRSDFLVEGDLVDLQSFVGELVVVHLEIAVDLEDPLDEVINIHVELAERLDHEEDVRLGRALEEP